MDELITWLRARLDRQQAAIQAYIDHRAGKAPCLNYEGQDPAHYSGYDSCSEHIRTCEATEYHDPAFGLAEVEAKRRILDKHARVLERDNWQWFAGSESESEWHVKALAQPYAGRDGWRADWVA